MSTMQNILWKNHLSDKCTRKAWGLTFPYINIFVSTNAPLRTNSAVFNFVVWGSPKSDVASLVFLSTSTGRGVCMQHETYYQAVRTKLWINEKKNMDKKYLYYTEAWYVAFISPFNQEVFSASLRNSIIKVLEDSKAWKKTMQKKNAKTDRKGKYPIHKVHNKMHITNYE